MATEFPFWIVTYRVRGGEGAARVRAETADLARTKFERDYPHKLVLSVAAEVFRRLDVG